MRGIMTEAVVAANNASLHTQKPYIPKRFLDLLEEHRDKYNPYIRGDAQLKQLFSYLTEMQIASGPYLWIRHWLEYEYGKALKNILMQPSLRRDRYTVGTSGYYEALHYITNDRQALLGPKRPDYCRGRLTLHPSSAPRRSPRGSNQSVFLVIRPLPYAPRTTPATCLKSLPTEVDIWR